MLVLTRRSGEALLIDGRIEVKVIDISGDKVRIGISAPNDVKILRKELSQTIQENQQAASSTADLAALRSLLGKR